MKKIFLPFVILSSLIISNVYGDEKEAVDNKQEEMTESEATDQGLAPSTQDSTNQNQTQQAN